MPFAIKDVLQYKRNDRQIREIHEQQYRKYVNELHQQQLLSYSHTTNPYYLSHKHIHEVEYSRTRNAVIRQNQYAKIQRENAALYQRLLKANQHAIVDNRNHVYEENLHIFNAKRTQQRFNEHKRINNDNQVLYQRLHNVRANLAGKEQCENDWKKHLIFMKKTCDYPENLDSFVSKMNKTQRKQAEINSAMRSARWND